MHSLCPKMLVLLGDSNFSWGHTIWWTNYQIQIEKHLSPVLTFDSHFCLRDNVGIGTNKLISFDKTKNYIHFGTPKVERTKNRWRREYIFITQFFMEAKLPSKIESTGRSKTTGWQSECKRDNRIHAGAWEGYPSSSDNKLAKAPPSRLRPTIVVQGRFRKNLSTYFSRSWNDSGASLQHKGGRKE